MNAFVKILGVYDHQYANLSSHLMHSIGRLAMIFAGHAKYKGSGFVALQLIHQASATDHPAARGLMYGNYFLQGIAIDVIK